VVGSCDICLKSSGNLFQLLPVSNADEGPGQASGHSRDDVLRPPIPYPAYRLSLVAYHFSLITYSHSIPRPSRTRISFSHKKLTAIHSEKVPDPFNSPRSAVSGVTLITPFLNRL
jgi:hypothetical protein